jgi:pimeloyl-ACP methyl ester carboxylesterase
MTHVEDKHREIARALIAPVRRVARPSAVVWDTTNRPAPNVGPIAMWSAGRGPCVVLVHGWEADHRDMDAFVAPLVAAGRRVVAFDLPAHGEASATHYLPEIFRCEPIAGTQLFRAEFTGR